MNPSMPTPERFFAAISAYQQTDAIKGAIELDLFTAIAEGNATAEALALKRQSSERGMRILCDFLVIMGFLTKNGNQYGLTPDSAMFLDRHQPTYIGSAIEFLLEPTLREAHTDVAAIVRKGGTLISDEGTVSPENPVWVKFARAMMPLMMLPARMLAQSIQVDPDKKVKLLDIAASHGMFGIVFAQTYPNVNVTALDWASVLEVAKENAQKFGVSDRVNLLPGSAFDVEFGSGYDLILLTNFLHHFDVATNERLLKKIYDALDNRGRVVTLEFIPNEDRVSPPPAASFAMTMLGTTAAGDAYTFAEYDQMFRNAGFAQNELREIPPAAQRVVISHK